MYCVYCLILCYFRFVVIDVFSRRVDRDRSMLERDSCDL